jgi:hypothetical protein
MKTTELKNKIDYRHIANQFNSSYKEANSEEIQHVKNNSEIQIISFKVENSNFNFVIISYNGREFAEVYMNDKLEKNQTIAANQNIESFKKAALQYSK